MSNPAAIASSNHQQMTPLQQNNDLETLFNTSEYFDLSAMSPGPVGDSFVPFNMDSGQKNGSMDTLENFTAMAMQNQGQPASSGQQGAGMQMLDGAGVDDFSRSHGSTGSYGGTGGYGDPANDKSFDFSFSGLGTNGFGGEALAGEGMDSVSDGLKGNENGQGL